jgi:hypothetical protein
MPSIRSLDYSTANELVPFNSKRRSSRRQCSTASASHHCQPMQLASDAAAPRSPRQKTATRRWCALQYRGRPQCALTSSQRFCARSSTVPELPSRCNTVAWPLGWGYCYGRGLLAAGSTVGRSGGSGVRHDCGGCVMHPPGVAFRTASAATDGAAALRQDVRSAEHITIWLRIGTP